MDTDHSSKPQNHKRGLPYGMLLFCARASERRFLKPFHAVIRQLYIHGLRPFVQWRLRRLHPDKEFILIHRHSVKSGEGFNVFLSDVDVTLVVQTPFTLSEADGLRKSYENLRKAWPMLGEIEIFFSSEWFELQRLWQQHGPMLQFIRDLKKIRWLENSNDNFNHIYHIYKRDRALRRIVEKYSEHFHGKIDDNQKLHQKLLQASVNGLFTEWVEPLQIDRIVHELRPFPRRVYAREIDTFVRFDLSTSRDLDLSESAALALLSVLPSHYDEEPQISAALTRLRNLSPVRELHRVVLRHEFLYANASPRMHVQHREAAWPWVERLYVQLKNWSPVEDRDNLLVGVNIHEPTRKESLTD